MDFSDYSSFPMVANTDYSPTNEAFSYPDTIDKAYIADSYTTSPDHSIANFFDCDSYFDRPLSSIEAPFQGAFVPKNPGTFNTTLPAATTTSIPKQPSNPTFNNPPFGSLDQFSSDFSFDTHNNPFDSSVSPQSQHSRTPSLCGEELSPRVPLKRESIDLPSSTIPLKRESIDLSSTAIPLKRESPDEENKTSNTSETPTAAPKRSQRKRGRPRVDRSTTADTSSPYTPSSSKCQRTSANASRLPHNQVERKYREGLNAELERLRRAVPTLPQSGDEGGLSAAVIGGQPKPSKAMVLAGAIEYIKKIERERDIYRAEAERLRGLARQGWNNGRVECMDEFLMDS